MAVESDPIHQFPFGFLKPITSSVMASLLIRIFSAVIFLSIQTLSELFYAGFTDAGSNITRDGIAEIEENGILRLTNHSNGYVGRAFYSSPFRFKNSSNGRVFSFSTCFAFAIIAENAKYSGHGLAFAVVPSKDLTGLPAQYLGLLNADNNGTHLFAVEFDTVRDFGLRDINDNHVGVDINSLVSKFSTTAAYFDDDGVEKDLRLKSGKVIMAWIDYDSTQNTVNVAISPSSSKPRKPLLSYKVDLSPIFNENMYVGFSASTGLLASSQYILGWSFAINGQAPDLDLSSLPPLPGSVKKKMGLIIGVSVSATVLAISIISFAFYLYRKFRHADITELWELQIGPHRYSYTELRQATKGFSNKELLGQGGFGKVYRGILPNSKTHVAVKRISRESKQGFREFLSEIATIGMLRHRNLVQLLGWCRRRQDLILVYEYMANGSLDKYLFDDPKTILNWEQRFRIIKGVASALLYLHEGYEQVVIHRDVKASNVLLDSDLNGRLGDFGLARVYEHGSAPTTTRVVGTLGYLAPELPRTGKSTTSSDVYAFGALLLEVACGRKPVELKALPEEMILVDWVQDKFSEGRLLDVVDPKLRGEFDEIEMVTVLKLGVICSHNEPKQRPSMRQIVRCLDGESGVVADDWKASSRIDGDQISRAGLDNFLLSLTSSCISKESSCSSTINGDMGLSLASLPSSHLLHSPRQRLQQV